MNGTRPLLAALAGGILLGLGVRLAGNPALMAAAQSLKPIGALWLAALKMTLVPLVFSLVASAVNMLLTARAGGRTIATTITVFAAMLVGVTVAGMAAMAVMLRLWPVPRGIFAGMIHGSFAATQAPPSLAAQLIALVPDNPVAAAAQGQIAPLVVFALSLGWAMTRLSAEHRASLATALAALAEAMMVIVKAVLVAAPIGVFVLSLDAAAEAGAGLVALLAQGVVMLVVLMTGAILFCHAVARFGGGMSWRRFARAAAAPQAVAAGICSSLATLPALLSAAEDALGIEPALARSTLPLAVSTFRFGTALSIAVSSLFAASAAGIALTPSQYLVAGLLIVLTNSGVVGIPGAAVIYAAEAPVFQAIGAPLAFIPLWIAVFAIPDIFVTVCNVTADLSALTVIRRILDRHRPPIGEAAAVAIGL